MDGLLRDKAHKPGKLPVPEATVQRVVAEELQPLRALLDQLANEASTGPSPIKLARVRRPR